MFDENFVVQSTVESVGRESSIGDNFHQRFARAGTAALLVLGMLLQVAAARGADSPPATSKAARELPAETVVRPGDLVPASVLAQLMLIGATRAGTRICAVGDHGYIIYSDDEGKTWRRADAPHSGLLTAVDFPDPQHGWVVGHAGLILATTDGGRTWIEQRYEPKEEQPLFDVLFRNDREGFAVGAYGLLLVTQDGGRRWQQRSIGKDIDRHLNYITVFGQKQLAIAAESGNLYTSNDGGQDWVDSTPYDGSFFGILDVPGGGLLAYGLLGHVFRSVDGGRNWLRVEGTGQASLMGGVATGAGTVVLVGAGGTVLVSHDAGQHFATVNSSSARTLSAVLVLDHQRLLLFGVGGTSMLQLPAATVKPLANGGDHR
ncbi:hypothetical protein RHOFW510R12_21740 [Rhodanobacter sp. FW510-R12]|uniref:WD40/YVTN/BNR-like repeat-containing protein n=2 Tax=Rhodanobacteraceae TaxID=1775411 RepID=UPI000689153E|nr:MULTISPECIES: YCF48-related protein [Rhodanobacter]UJJ53442.1 YCF48-related protein [Rhodanobacter thiooxydans]